MELRQIDSALGDHMRMHGYQWLGESLGQWLVHATNRKSP